MDVEEKKRLIQKAKQILSEEIKSDLSVKPWDSKKIKKGSDWFANDTIVQDIIEKYLRI